MKILLIVLGIPALIIAVHLLRSAWERVHPVVVNYSVQSRKLPAEFDGMRVLYLADFHNQDYGKQKENLYQMIRDTEPDLILLGGDMIVETYEPFDLSEFDALLSHLPEGVPCCFARGNHENRLFSDSKYVGDKNEFLSLLAKYGVTMLASNSAAITRGEATIVLSSLDLPGAYYKKGKKKELSQSLLATGFTKTEEYQICLVHSPLYREEVAMAGADLVLSGHFHGGTIYLGEKLGGLMTPQYQFFSKDCKGIRYFGEDREKAGIVSAGLGTHTINIRLNDRPEIIVVTLEKKYAD